MTTMAYRRRTDVSGQTGAALAGRSTTQAATLAGEEPATQSGISSALATITGYIPTEILMTYVAVAAALGGATSTASSEDARWLSFAAFLVATPVVVWLVYAGKVRTAGKSLPRRFSEWPRWEMVAATVGYLAWAFALPGTPFASFAWYDSAIAGIAVLITATVLGLLTPVVGVPLQVRSSAEPSAAASAATAAALAPSGAATASKSPEAPSGSAAEPTATVPAATDESTSPPPSGRQATSIVPAAPASAVVADFLPSRSGLHFPNTFPHEAELTVGIPGIATLPLGDAANGLCGGMSFTVRDLFEASIAPPPDTTPPAGGTPRFEYLVERQIASLDLGQTALRLYELGSPLLSDGAPAASVLGTVGLLARGRSQVMALDEWPLVRADLDGGKPSCLGLVRRIDIDPRALGSDHQVLAYGYELAGDQLSLAIYDPNHPDDDTVRLMLSLADPSRPIEVDYSPDDGPVFCFTRIPYTPADPGPWRPS